MNYTLEEIYLAVGRDDKTAGVTFRVGSDAYNLYGDFLTLLFLYTQYEREDMEAHVRSNTPFAMTGYLKAKNLGFDLSEEKVAMLKSTGIHTNDIANISYFKMPSENTFHSVKTRTIRKLNIQMRMQQKGKDLDWMYGLAKRFVQDGVGLCPEERSFYLAGRLFYESDEITPDEKVEIYSEDNQLNPSVEWELLRMKCWREMATDDEQQRLVQMTRMRESLIMNVIGKYLNDAGSSLVKLASEDMDQVTKLVMKAIRFKERRLNTVGTVPIYVDLDSYMHIYMRHVEEVKVDGTFEDKDNFQWVEEDVFTVMEKVINQANDQIQAHFKNKPGQRYSRYGRQSVYFEGDYYTFHIEPNGRISTFHKNRRNLPTK